MAKYIDAEKLKDEIKKRISLFQKEKKTEGASQIDVISLGARAAALEEILVFIDSLQQEQPEVDLEEVVMIDNVIMNMTAEGYNNGYKTRPFYEGVLRRLNARKEERK